MGTPEQQYHIRTAEGKSYGPGTIETIRQWASEGRVPLDAMLEPVGGGDAVGVSTVPELLRVLHAPPTVSSGVPARAPDQTGGGSALIPYRNPSALIGYYVSVFSLIPFLALLFAPAAIILGIIGHIKARKHPESRGMAHAWVAIILGSLTFIGNVVAIALLATA